MDTLEKGPTMALAPWPQHGICGVFSVAVVAILVVFTNSATSLRPGQDVVTNHWYVQLHGHGGVDVAKAVAARTGFSYVSPVSKQLLFNIQITTKCK